MLNVEASVAYWYGTQSAVFQMLISLGRSITCKTNQTLYISLLMYELTSIHREYVLVISFMRQMYCSLAKTHAPFVKS